ncbi:hypothetical protein ACPOL_3400 [Acidisarcina polymorpha]|uniref:Tachylectin 2 domain-containing protein n=1 Tax=Acidisarcina polymorpha TaxID=2211140 RepID=A0A2Z5G1S5_9BACT|nr:tachylectin-related carbohydrate-binding protein [Acidisarcina polymorpha]AXC12687.1 hypothetical protein ACPOL_3400 [Acidisarcina polymorpha]
MGFAGGGSNNSILVNGCKNLENLTVTLQVTEDLIEVNNKGFSLQLNSYPQPTAITPNSTQDTTFPGKIVGQLNWFQYLIIVANNQVTFEIQYWASAQSYRTAGPNNNPPEIRWPPRYTPNPANTSPWLPVFPNSSITGTVVGSTASNTVVAGSVITIKLPTDSNGNVTGATFSITDPGGKVQSASTQPWKNYAGQSEPADYALFPIYGFQADLVSAPGLPCTFSSGAGTLTYSISQGALAVQAASTQCSSVRQTPTGESSNTIYREITPASGATVSQSVYVPQLLSYGDPNLPGAVANPVGVGFAGWSAFMLLFGGQNIYGQSRIYAVDGQGQLLAYADAGTIGNVSSPVVVGFGGWLQFKFLFGGWNTDGQGRIYAVNDQGQLLSYGDAASIGNVSSPAIVGFGGWLQFKFLFGGRNATGQGRIYAVNDQGQLLCYTDNGNTGNVSAPVIVGFDGWLQFKFLFAGKNQLGQDRIYAVNDQGQLLSYTDNGLPGNVSAPTTVGFGGWTDFKFLFTGTNELFQDRIYAVYA